MLPPTITGQREWTAASIDDTANWYYSLPADALATLGPSLQDLRRHPCPVTALRATPAQHEAWRAALQPVHAALATGRGFAILDRVPGERYSVPEAQAIYWLIGQLLGEPFVQNVQGTLLYDVRDTGQDVAQGARFSVTNYESSFHTDNSFGDDVLDYVGLFCLRTALAGGRSQLVSACAVHNELRAQRPDVLEILCQPFHVDRRGGVKEGQAATARHPVFAWDSGMLLVRYLRYWIESGHQKIGAPLTPAQTEAFDVLDRQLGRADLRVEFDLRPGQIFFINNRWLLHNRTAFTDHPEPERRRHLVRLWLQERATV
jgi:alpha-ketoglutarate-dependent taurine dioxygenase